MVPEDVRLQLELDRVQALQDIADETAAAHMRRGGVGKADEVAGAAAEPDEGKPAIAPSSRFAAAGWAMLRRPRSATPTAKAERPSEAADGGDGGGLRRSRRSSIGSSTASRPSSATPTRGRRGSSVTGRSRYSRIVNGRRITSTWMSTDMQFRNRHEAVFGSRVVIRGDCNRQRTPRTDI